MPATTSGGAGQFLPCPAIHVGKDGMQVALARHICANITSVC